MSKNILMMISSILLVTGLFEVFLQLIDYPAPPTYGWGYASSDSSRSHELNELGSRGKPLPQRDTIPPSTIVVVLLGDSQVECVPCRFDELPERRLEYYLNSNSHLLHRVYSIAWSGWGQDQQLLMLQRFFAAHRADLVVLWFTPYNDVWNNTFPSHFPWNGRPKPTFRLEDGRVVGPNQRMGGQPDFLKVYFLLKFLHRRAYNEVPAGWWNSDIVQYTKYAIPGIDDMWSIKYLPVPRGWLNRDDCAGHTEISIKDINDLSIWGRESIWEEKAHVNVYSAWATPRLNYGMRLTRWLLEQIRETASQHGANFEIFTTNDFYAEKLFESSDLIIAKLDGYCLELSRRVFLLRMKLLFEKFDHVRIDIGDTEDIYQSDKDPHLGVRATDEAMKRLAHSISGREKTDRWGANN